MKITRCSCQGGESLEEEFAKGRRCLTDVNKMREFLNYLGDLEFSKPIYGLTSVDRICLLSQDDYSTPWWVIVSRHQGDTDYKIETRIPRDKRPWLNCQLESCTPSAREAAVIVRNSLDFSEGWSEELGGKPIGLQELLATELRGEWEPGGLEAFQATRIPWRNETRLDKDGEVLVTLLCQTADDEYLAYRHDAAFTSNRWGLVEAQETRLGANWHPIASGAFYFSKAWPQGPPAWLL